MIPMKQLLLICAVVALVGCGGKKPLTKEEQAKLIEEAIRRSLGKYNDELTKADLVKVTTLSLGGPNNKLTEVPKGLEKLTKLGELNLNHNKLTNVNGLEKLTQLTGLDLRHNQLTSVKGLGKLPQLEWLYLEDNQLTDVKDLEKLTQLETLFLEDNPDLTKAQIDELQKALPNCEIFSNPKK